MQAVVLKKDCFWHFVHDEIEANYSFTLILLNKNIDYLCSNLHTHMLAT